MTRPQAQGDAAAGLGRWSPWDWQRPAGGPREGAARDLASGVVVCP